MTAPTKRGKHRDLTYTVTMTDDKPPLISVDAPGRLDRNGMVYLDPAVQDALVNFIDTLSPEPGVVTWSHAQPDWREREVQQ